MSDKQSDTWRTDLGRKSSPQTAIESLSPGQRAGLTHKFTTYDAEKERQQPGASRLHSDEILSPGVQDQRAGQQTEDGEASVLSRMGRTYKQMQIGSAASAYEGIEEASSERPEKRRRVENLGDLERDLPVCHTKLTNAKQELEDAMRPPLLEREEFQSKVSAFENWLAKYHTYKDEIEQAMSAKQEKLVLMTKYKKLLKEGEISKISLEERIDLFKDIYEKDKDAYSFVGILERDLAKNKEELKNLRSIITKEFEVEKMKELEHKIQEEQEKIKEMRKKEEELSSEITYFKTDLAVYTAFCKSYDEKAAQQSAQVEGPVQPASPGSSPIERTGQSDHSEMGSFEAFVDEETTQQSAQVGGTVQIDRSGSSLVEKTGQPDHSEMKSFEAFIDQRITHFTTVVFAPVCKLDATEKDIHSEILNLMILSRYKESRAAYRILGRHFIGKDAKISKASLYVKNACIRAKGFDIKKVGIQNEEDLLTDNEEALARLMVNYVMKDENKAIRDKAKNYMETFTKSRKDHNKREKEKERERRAIEQI